MDFTSSPPLVRSHVFYCDSKHRGTKATVFTSNVRTGHGLQMQTVWIQTRCSPVIENVVERPKGSHCPQARYLAGFVLDHHALTSEDIPATYLVRTAILFPYAGCHHLLGGRYRTSVDQFACLGILFSNPYLLIGVAQNALQLFSGTEAGSEAEYEAALMKIAQFYKDKKMRDGFTVGYAITGKCLPLYSINLYGKSAADFWTQNDKRKEMGGAELQALIDEANAVVRMLETFDLTPRPDHLSYTPE